MWHTSSPIFVKHFANERPCIDGHGGIKGGEESRVVVNIIPGRDDMTSWWD